VARRAVASSSFRSTAAACCPTCQREREFFIDNLLVRIHYIIVMMKWTGLAPWEFEGQPVTHPTLTGVPRS